MRYRVPPGCGAVVHDGIPLMPDPDGCIEAPKVAIAALAVHEIHPLSPDTTGSPRPVRGARKRDAR